MHLTFLTPSGALLVLAALLPLGALALHERRARRARRSLGLAPPPPRSQLLTIGALVAFCALLALALAQPVVQSTHTTRMRTDAQIFYLFDTSESMRASAGPHRPTRVQRAVAEARLMRLAIHDVPSGVATMTDRVLPNVFPTGSEQLFAAALADTVGVNRPPPKGFNETATTFASLDTFAGTNFFSVRIAHRLVVLFTDGETAPYFAGDLHDALHAPPHTSFVIVRIGNASDRIYNGRKPDRNYRPDPRAGQAARSLAAVVGGKAVAEGDVGGASAAARSFLGRGPISGVGEGLRVVVLAPWLAIAALIPLLALLWRRNLV